MLYYVETEMGCTLVEARLLASAAKYMRAKVIRCMIW